MLPEFGLMDSINYFRGLNDVFTALYPQLHYYDQLRAPHRRLYIFDAAGHPQIFQQPERFTDIMVNTVLPETLR
jgi:hypothetical protein